MRGGIGPYRPCLFAMVVVVVVVVFCEVVGILYATRPSDVDVRTVVR